MKMMKKRLLVVLMVLTAFMLVTLPAMAQELSDSIGAEATQQAIDWAWLNGIVAFVLPLAIAFLMKQQWSTQVKKVFAFVISAAVGIIATGFNQGWVFTSVVDFFRLAMVSISEIWVIGQVAYLSFWSGTKPAETLAAFGSGRDEVAPAA